MTMPPRTARFLRRRPGSTPPRSAASSARGSSVGTAAWSWRPPRRVDQLRSALGRDADEVTFVEDTDRLRAAVERLPRAARLRRQGAGCPVLRRRRADAGGADACRAGRLPPARGGDQRRLRRGRRRPALPLRRRLAPRTCSRSGCTPTARCARAARCRPTPASTTRSTCSPAWPRWCRRPRTPPPRLLVAGRRRPARRLVRARGADRGIDPDVVDDMALAVTEVLTNALLHGGPPRSCTSTRPGPPGSVT